MSGRDGQPARAPTGGPAARWTSGLLFGAAGVIGFSGTVPATRVAAPVFGAVTLTFARIVIAAVLGALTLAAGGRMRWPGRHYLAGLLAMGLGLAVGYPLFLALAVQKVPASHAAVVIALVPAATAVLSAARNRERLPRPFWLACLTGLAAVTGYAATSGGASAGAGDLWLGAAVLSCAAGYVEGARVARRIGAVPALCWAMLLLVPVAAPLLTAYPVTAARPTRQASQNRGGLRSRSRPAAMTAVAAGTRAMTTAAWLAGTFCTASPRNSG